MKVENCSIYEAGFLIVLKKAHTAWVSDVFLIIFLLDDFSSGLFTSHPSLSPSSDVPGDFRAPFISPSESSIEVELARRCE